MIGWQWRHDHYMQIIFTLFQSDHHTSTLLLSFFLQSGCSALHVTKRVKRTEDDDKNKEIHACENLEDRKASSLKITVWMHFWCLTTNSAWHCDYFDACFAGRECCHCTCSKLSTMYIQQRICRSWNATSKGLDVLQIVILPDFFYPRDIPTPK